MGRLGISEALLNFLLMLPILEQLRKPPMYTYPKLYWSRAPQLYLRGTQVLHVLCLVWFGQLLAKGLGRCSEL